VGPRARRAGRLRHAAAQVAPLQRPADGGLRRGRHGSLAGRCARAAGAACWGSALPGASAVREGRRRHHGALRRAGRGGGRGHGLHPYGVLLFVPQRGAARGPRPAVRAGVHRAPGRSQRDPRTPDHRPRDPVGGRAAGRGQVFPGAGDRLSRHAVGAGHRGHGEEPGADRRAAAARLPRGGLPGSERSVVRVRGCGGRGGAGLGCAESPAVPAGHGPGLGAPPGDAGRAAARSGCPWRGPF